MQTNVRMRPHLDQANRPMSPGSEHLDTNDMVVVFVVLQRPLGDSIDRLRMVVLLAVLVQKRPQPQHMARHQCTVAHHIIFGMQHNYLLRPAVPNQRLFDVSILFCKESKREGRDGRLSKMNYKKFLRSFATMQANGEWRAKFSIVYSMGRNKEK